MHLLDAVTVSAAQAGGLPEYDMQLCGCLKEELLDFAVREGILSGPIFITRRGTPVGRTTVTALIQSLAHDAQVEAGKCTPRCLRKLYLPDAGAYPSQYFGARTRGIRKTPAL